MTNKEILHADLLDILFENRNKAYGAYALRKNYSHRLQWALGIGLSLASILIFINDGKEKLSDDPHLRKPEIVVHTATISDDKPLQQKTQQQKPTHQAAQMKSTAQILIVHDNIPTDVPTEADLRRAEISDHTTTGAAFSDVVQPNTNGEKNGTVKKVDEPQENKIVVSQSDAQFPGGKEAFAKFLTRYLKTPGDLADGEKKVVVVRFMVDEDGTISKTEILQSDGDEYSKEVIRVLSKMPKWIPAMQNGAKVTTWFTQPVSFIGVE
ncbi:MAG TPA: energy transducer TonB [Chitinophagaceae bacterium]|jgi:periplasmic protein TonB|nr:energy transducer TonB [Chitinophagaceae bacterium]